MNEQRILIWYRSDLRLHDHEPLYRAMQQKAQIIPVYCFDPRQFSQTAFGFPKTGAFRAKFLLESVADLRQSLTQLGSHLILRRGLPEVIIPSLVEQLQVTAVYYHGEVTSEELAVETALKRALSEIKVQVYRFLGTPLYHLEDLPFAINQIPELFTKFRQAIEKKATIRSAIAPPIELPPLPAIAIGNLPTLQELGLDLLSDDPRAVLSFQGGETAALARLCEIYIDRYNHCD